jgi:hypothetical protein
MNRIVTAMLLILLPVVIPPALRAQSQTEPGARALLTQSFELAGAHSLETQRYVMESRMMTHGPDGAVVKTDIYRLRLQCAPAAPAGGAADRYTCLEFTIQLGDSPEVSIPSLSGWSYAFRYNPTGRYENGQTLGIPHEPFDNLVDATGKTVPPANAYHVYNAFIDFHSFTVFIEGTSTGGGIQDLTRIGQRIVHAASGSTPAVNLGSNVAPGSYFKNGEVTLELKGAGLVQGRPCAIVGYDSGQSSFLMITKPVPEVEVRTAGSSHYWGDIHKDLQSQWVRKATLTEIVVSETTLPAPPNKIDAVIERAITVLNVSDPAAW